MVSVSGASFRMSTRSDVGGNISFYAVPSDDIDGYVHPLSCEACSQRPAAAPSRVAILFRSAKTHKLQWAHLACLSKLKFDAETPIVAIHPDLNNTDVGVAALSKCLADARAGNPSTIGTVPFQFAAAYSVRDLTWPSATISEASRKDVPKRALRVNTSDEVEPTLACEATAKPMSKPKKELKATQQAASGEASDTVAQQTSGSGDGGSSCSSTQQKDKAEADCKVGSCSSTEQKDEAKTDCKVVNSAAEQLAAEGSSAPPAIEAEAAAAPCEASKTGSRKELLLRAGA